MMERELGWSCEWSKSPGKLENSDREVNPSEVLVPVRKMSIRTSRIRSGKDVIREI